VSDSPVQAMVPLGFQWQTSDPFLFCVHHDDAYPAGNEAMGPAASLAGRNIGMDFEGVDGWRMYHGDVIPGFPRHPHRGFETITMVRRGLIDHSDSLGATARFGHGDVQWMTAGKGIVHSEMFPLVRSDAPNPTELFQIWLNLPREDKLVEPHFSMLWSDTIPRHTFTDAAGRATEVAVVAGSLHDMTAPPPPPSSWAARESADVAIWTLKLAPEAEWTLPAASAQARRTLYFFAGSAIRVADTDVPPNTGVSLRGDAEVALVNGPDEAELLLLQGVPIAEPVSHYGPFVMNNRAEIAQAINDYQRTQFGGWPWDSDGPVHPRDDDRFARLIRSGEPSARCKCRLRRPGPPKSAGRCARTGSRDAHRGRARPRTCARNPREWRRGRGESRIAGTGTVRLPCTGSRPDPDRARRRRGRTPGRRRPGLTPSTPVVPLRARPGSRRRTRRP
jgi:redox-sensitive bicupin YhaK (pirin superfamily)